MSQLTELTHKLKEIFQINRADLDFGIYRILNTRSQEIEHYLSETLPRTVRQAFGENQSEQLSGWKNELATLQKTLTDAGVPLESSTKYQELQNKIEYAKKGSAEHEAAVYRHLLTFFSRYYEEGDFISQRRYKGDTYAVPYAGEEVLLHWANKDQYYTKSGENFSNYRFTLADGRAVFFRLNSADIAKDNRKDNDAKRLFTLATAQTIERENEDGETEIIDIEPISQSEDGNTLTILFDYKPFEKSAKQEKILEKDLQTLLVHDLLQTTWSALAERKPTEKNPNRTLLEKHLSDYTQKNTADYFIHKDLGGFLRRELDFYIKNEMMNLDDVQSAQTFAHIEANLRLIQTLRSIALEVIDFLAQLENFQKKLWLKKKFVAGCHYLITLNHIFSCYNDSHITNEDKQKEQEDKQRHKKLIDGLFEQIANNSKQLTQWQTLFNVPSANAQAFLNAQKASIAGGGWNPLDSNSYDDLQYLVVDTSLFSAEFQSAVISALSSSLSDFDSHINGTLIHSDNFQALNLLQARYREQVKCIYIDPPYNTGGDGFIYKDGYQKSSWLSLIKQTTIFSKKILNPYSSFFAMNIDKRQLFDGKILLDEGLSQLSFVNAIVNVNNPKGRSDQKHLPTAHDNILLYATDGAISYGWQPQNKVLKRYNKLDTNGKYREIDLRKTGDNDLATDRPKMAYSFAYNQENEHLLPIELGDLIPQGYIEIIPMKTSEIKGRWRWEYKTAKENISRLIAKFQPNKQQWTVFEKDYLGNDEKVLPTSVWDEKPFNSERGTEIFVNLGFEKELFPRPKPVGLLEHLLEHLIDKNSLVLDYFAGSGTTAHAVINLNREDNGNRQYILVEQGEYFDTVLKPRVQKVIFSKEYKDGKPVPSDKVSGSLNGVPQIVKVLKLESYEDTLNNLELHRSNLFDRLQEQAQHDYLLHYMLNIESRDSLLNVSHFAKPFDYGLNISTTSAGAYEWQKVDLVETFNYLIGARVIGIDDKRIEKGFVAVECRLPNQSGDDKTLIIWRDCEKWNYDNLYSEEEFGRNFRGCKTTLFGIMNFNPKHSKNLNDNDYVQVYINGDHTLETVWDGEQSGSLKIRSIEAEFLALMFAGDE